MCNIVFWTTILLGFICICITLALIFIESRVESGSEESKVTEEKETEAKEVHEKEKEKREKRVELTEDEAKIMEIIKKKKTILQADLSKEVSISRTKLSKIIQSLEKKGLITREKDKNRYVIKLVEEETNKE